MKSITKVFIALLLFATVYFGSLDSNANSLPMNSTDYNEVSSSSNFHNNAHSDIHPNETIKLPVATFTYEKAVEIANKTQCVLRDVGVDGNSLKWHIGDVNPLRAVGKKFNNDAFSFASNYQIDCGVDKEKINVQFSAVLTIDGKRKINAGIINQDSNYPTKLTLDEMMSPSDKSINNPPVKIDAFIKQKDGTTIWFFEVARQTSHIPHDKL